MGTTAPRFVYAKGFPHTADDVIRFDLEASFEPKDDEDLAVGKDERNSRIVLTTRIGKGVVGVDIPILVKEISFRTTVCIQLTTMPGFPFVKTVSVSFYKQPEFNFVLKPLKGMDLMDLPGLNNFLYRLIGDILGWMFVQPNAFVLDLDAIMNGSGVAAESAVGVLMVKIYEARDLKNVEVL